MLCQAHRTTFKRPFPSNFSNGGTHHPVENQQRAQHKSLPISTPGLSAIQMYQKEELGSLLGVGVIIFSVVVGKVGINILWFLCYCKKKTVLIILSSKIYIRWLRPIRLIMRCCTNGEFELHFYFKHLFEYVNTISLMDGKKTKKKCTVFY
jgi:hypothetical protein